jgi:hypothetical protein
MFGVLQRRRRGIGGLSFQVGRQCALSSTDCVCCHVTLSRRHFVKHACRDCSERAGPSLAHAKVRSVGAGPCSNLCRMVGVVCDVANYQLRPCWNHPPFPHRVVSVAGSHQKQESCFGPFGSASL